MVQLPFARLCVVTSLVLVACSSPIARTDAGGGGTPDAPIPGADAPLEVPDAPVPDAPVPDAPSPTDAPWVDPPGGSVMSFVVSILDAPEPDGEMAPGFDLDGTASTGGSECYDQPDYVSAWNGPGVDNNFGAAAALLGAMYVDEGTVAGYARAILGGYLLVLVLSDVDDLTRDGRVFAHLHLAATPGGGPPLTAGGTLSPDQPLVGAVDLGSAIEARIESGLLRVRGVASVPMEIDMSSTITDGTDALAYTLSDASVSGRLVGGTLVDGEMGGSLRVVELAAALSALGLPVTEGTVRAITSPDLEPALGECQSVSVGLTFSAVPTSFTP